MIDQISPIPCRKAQNLKGEIQQCLEYAFLMLISRSMTGKEHEVMPDMLRMDGRHVRHGKIISVLPVFGKLN